MKEKKMEKEILKKQKQSSKEGYVVVPNYFLREWVKVLGVGPAMLYLYLLTYCHKGKDIAWPTISTLTKKMNLTPKTITKYRQALLKYGLIKKVSKRKTSSGCHMRNIYQLTPFDMGKNTLPVGNIFSYLEGKFTPTIGENLPTNNTNLKHYQFNNNKERKDAAVVAVNFKKLKEKGDLSACDAQADAQAEEKMRVIRERMVKLNFKEEFMEKILKEYSGKKIEEKLDLLIEKKNIQNPAGWLRAALKNDYRGEKPAEQETCSRTHPSKGEEIRRMDSRFRGNDIKGSGNDPIPNVIAISDSLERGNLNSPLFSPPKKEGLPCVVEEITAQGKGEGDKILSSEEVRERLRSLREKLMAMS